MVAGVLLFERDAGLIDSAGVVADRTLMGFDYLNGEPREAAASRPIRWGRPAGRRCTRSAAFERSVGSTSGSSSTTRTSTSPCACAPGARLRARPRAPPRSTATRRPSAPPAGTSTGGRLVAWIHAAALRGYGQARGRRPGVRRRGGSLRRPAAGRPHPRRALRGACGDGAMPAAFHRARPPSTGSATSACGTPCACAEPGAGRVRGRRRRRRRRRSRQQRPAASASASSFPSQGGQEAAPRGGAGQGAGLDRGDPRERRRRHELDLCREPVASDEPGVLRARVGEARLPGGVADMPDDRLGDQLEAPAGDPRPDVEVDVLVEGEVALVVAAQLGRIARGAAGRRRRRRRRPRAGRAGRRWSSPAPARRRGRPWSAPGRRCRDGHAAPRARAGPPSSWRMRGCTPPSAGSASSASSSGRRSPARARCRR